MYQQITWPLYKQYGHAFDAFKTMVSDDGAAIFSKLEEGFGGPIPSLTPAVRGLSRVCLLWESGGACA
jgi:translation initiation factor 2 subunit 1